MRQIYQDLTRENSYNNLGELLEFIRYFENEKSKNESLKLKDAFNSYYPDVIATLDKYRAGTCIQLGAKFCQMLSEQNIHAECVAKEALNYWTCLPFPE